MSDQKKNLQALEDENLESVSGGVKPIDAAIKPVEPVVTEIQSTPTPIIRPVQPKEDI
jgi:hypothetical protein